MDRRNEMRRSSLPSQPYTKVVGFKVEGMPPSPGGDQHEQYVGSPSPVIIPTSAASTTAVQDTKRTSIDSTGSGKGVAAALPPQLSGPAALQRHSVSGIPPRDRTSVDHGYVVHDTTPLPCSDDTREPYSAAAELNALRQHVSATSAMGSGSQAPSATGVPSRQPSPMPTLTAPSPAASPSAPASPAPLRSAGDSLASAAAAADSGVPSSAATPGATTPRTGSGATAAAAAALAAMQAPPPETPTAPAGPPGTPGVPPLSSVAPTSATKASGGRQQGSKDKQQQHQSRPQRQQQQQQQQQQGPKQGKQGRAAPSPAPRSTSSASVAGEQQRKGPLQPSGAPAGSKGAHTQGLGTSEAAGPGAQQQQRRGPAAGTTSLHGLDLFAHLPAPKQMDVATALQRCKGDVHPEIVRLGLDYAAGRIRGADARCVAMLEAFKRVVQDYHVPEGKLLQRDLAAHLSSNISFIVECRPLGTAMGNAIKYLKTYITHLDGRLDEQHAREMVLNTIDSYIREKVLGCCKVLVDKAMDKIVDGDVVLTYAMSSVVLKLLLAAKQAGRFFRVIVVDGRPLLEGRELMRRLLAAGITVSYSLTSGLSYLIKEVTKVFLGAAAVLSNGTVISRVGSALVAMTAHAAHVPVLICAESHKFHERVQLDSITNNELGDPEQLVHVDVHPELQALEGWQKERCLGVLNLLYDAMPCEYIDIVCTEFGPLPPSSVPVILRESREEWLPSAQ